MIMSSKDRGDDHLHNFGDLKGNNSDKTERPPQHKHPGKGVYTGQETLSPMRRVFWDFHQISIKAYM